MAKSLNDVLKGVNKSDTRIYGAIGTPKIVPGSTGDDPGVDYAGKMKDERDFVALHKTEKFPDRVGNGDDVYNASKVKKAKMERHGHDPDPKARTVYKQANEAKDPREYGYEGEMAMSQIKSIMNHANQLMGMLKPDTDMPEWVQSKITLANDYIQTAADYFATEMTEASKCNMTEAGTMCEVHGMKSCGSGKEEMSASDKEPRYNGKKKQGRQLITDKKKIEEREMTAADKKREQKLKDKYDDSSMKANMQKQYGAEKGKQVYFAYIRKKAMNEQKNKYVREDDDTIEFPNQPGKKYYRQQDGSYGEKETHSIKFPGDDKKHYVDGPDPTKRREDDDTIEFPNQPGKKYYRQQDGSYGEKEKFSKPTAAASSEKRYTTSVYPDDGDGEFKNMKRDNSAQKMSQKNFDKEFDSSVNRSLRTRASGARTARIVNKARQSLKKEQADTHISTPSTTPGDTGRV